MSAFEVEPACEDIVRILLKKTNHTHPPTDAEEIAEYLGLRIDYFDSHSQYQLEKRVKAFIWPDRQLIGVYRGLTEVQRRFSVLHEIGHLVLPDHIHLVDNDGRIKDDSSSLSNSSAKQKQVYLREVEANQFAADCLFQLEHFDNYIARQKSEWINILLAADTYEASIEATARRWIERTKSALALVAFNPVDRTEAFSPLEILYTITSSTFAQRYFSGLQKGQRVQADSAIYKLHYRLENLGSEASEIIRVQTSEDEFEEFRMNLFSNSYRVFGILHPMSESVSAL